MSQKEKGKLEKQDGLEEKKKKNWHDEKIKK